MPQRNALIKIYAGLSLDAAVARTVLPRASFSLPIARGELVRDIDEGVQVVVLIDGKFHQNLAVAPDEIRDALSCGLRIYGASSMGALRAAELQSFGMIGHGLIFEHIAAAKIFRDDFLGQVFSEEGDIIRSGSFAYIDLLMNLLELERGQHITHEKVRRLLRIYGDLFYEGRSWPALRRALSGGARSDQDLLPMAEAACRRMGSQKRRDALGVLQLVRTDLLQIADLNGRFQ